jgi:Methyltransferase domain
MMSTVAATRSSKFRRYLEILPTIEGWFSHEAACIWWTLLDHQTATGITGDLLEIGVWRGKAALQLALHARRDAREQCVLLDKYVERADLEYQFARLGMILDEQATVMEWDARELSRLEQVVHPPQRFRWIHIDEEHSAAAILEDLHLAARLLCDGGIVCINAYMSPTHPQVTAAILRYVEDPRGELCMFLGGFDKAYLTTRSHFRAYMEFCHHHLIAQLETHEAYATLTKKTRADELNFFGICDRSGGKALMGLDGDDERIEY